MTRFILAIACAIALVSTLQAQVPVPAPPPPPPPPAFPGVPAAIAPVNPFAQKFEYEFVSKPRGTDAFKKLLKERGKDGWEYVGLIPGEDELIFKKAQSGAVMLPPALPDVGTTPPVGGLGIAPPRLTTPPSPPAIPPIKDPTRPK